MAARLQVAMVGLGRMGQVHARNLHRIAKEEGTCAIGALVDADIERTKRFAEEHGLRDAALFSSVEEAAQSGRCQAAMIATPTNRHQEHAATLVQAGWRVLLEKPLTGTVEGDRKFAAKLDRDHPRAVMLAFQRRFDEALQYGREVAQSGAIGRVFKIYSALEDSNPAPNGYQSDGILPDMSIHNVDEILWLTGRMPDRALAIGSRVYSHALTTCTEDFDDAMLYMWFGQDLLAQVQVARNHVSGYRVETILFGDKGQVQIGHFAQHPTAVVVEAFGKRGTAERLARREFEGGPDDQNAPEFVPRFGKAYEAELRAFIECCVNDRDFPTTHRDGVRAQEVIAAGMERMLTSEAGAPVQHHFAAGR